jgi:hypothetical protein
MLEISFKIFYLIFADLLVTDKAIQVFINLSIQKNGGDFKGCMQKLGLSLN